MKVKVKREAVKEPEAKEAKEAVKKEAVKAEQPKQPKQEKAAKPRHSTKRILNRKLELKRGRPKKGAQKVGKKSSKCSMCSKVAIRYKDGSYKSYCREHYNKISAAYMAKRRLNDPGYGQRKEVRERLAAKKAAAKKAKKNSKPAKSAKSGLKNLKKSVAKNPEKKQKPPVKKLAKKALKKAA